MTFLKTKIYTLIVLKGLKSIGFLNNNVHTIENKYLQNCLREDNIIMMYWEKV